MKKAVVLMGACIIMAAAVSAQTTHHTKQMKASAPHHSMQKADSVAATAGEATPKTGAAKMEKQSGVSQKAEQHRMNKEKTSGKTAKESSEYVRSAHAVHQQAGSKTQATDKVKPKQ